MRVHPNAELEKIVANWEDCGRYRGASEASVIAARRSKGRFRVKGLGLMFRVQGWGSRALGMGIEVLGDIHRLRFRAGQGFSKCGVLVYPQTLHRIHGFQEVCPDGGFWRGTIALQGSVFLLGNQEQKLQKAPNLSGASKDGYQPCRIPIRYLSQTP